MASVLPYGSWPSSFPIDALTAGVVFVAEPRARAGISWWLEGRPEEAGRQALVRREPDRTLTRLTPPGFNVRCRVHEYGGAPFLADPELAVVSDFATGRLHRVIAPGELEPLTPDRRWRFADLVNDAHRGRLIAVREDHEQDTLATHGEAVNALVTIDLESQVVRPLVEGADFYASPRLSPDGRWLAWLQWHHPNMPWDGRELWLARLETDGIAERRRVAGSSSDWVAQPRWSPSGVLHFVAEPDGWMNLHRWRDGTVECVLPIEAELASPDWVFGLSNYDFLADGSILAIARSDGRDRLLRIDPDGATTPLGLPYTELSGLVADGRRALFRAASPVMPTALVELDTTSGEVTVLSRASSVTHDPTEIAEPVHVEFPTTGDRTAHGLFYAPTNPAVEVPDDERPPLIVTSHGGPTAQAYAAYATTVQLFTSRGIAVLDVDYGGSTGYGHDYRKRLEGTWGVTDVDDCVAGARWLGEQGLVDGSRLAIRGGSASGYTTLAALAFRDAFDAGISYFGIGDLLGFVRETHKFESRYLDRLIGPLPESEGLYRERSPILHVEQIDCPVLVLQGAEDRVVPPSEAERIVDALFERGVPHAFLLFPGEDHGFRGADAIIRAFGAELSFLGEVFRFTPADELPLLELVRPPRPTPEA